MTRMKLLFVNGSKQQKKIVESDYMEDIIDMILDFFETHNRFPHVMYMEEEDDYTCIKIAGTAEHFRITDVDEEGKKALTEWLE